MGVDIRIPIGLMFAILGVLLTAFGFATAGDTELYTKSLGVNINVWAGLTMLIFGSLMLGFTFWKKIKK